MILRNPALTTRPWLKALEDVAKAAEVMCQHLDANDESIRAWGAPALESHDRLHQALGSYERLRDGEEV